MSRGLPVVEGLFEQTADGARLIGSRCRTCGTLYFPQAIACRDPHDGDRTVERVPLPDRGVLHSYTVQRYRPPSLFRMEPWAPYAIGLVDLGGGLRVMGMMTGVAPEDLAIGLRVRVVAAPLCVGSTGEDVLTWMFAPDEAAA